MHIKKKTNTSASGALGRPQTTHLKGVHDMSTIQDMSLHKANI